MFQTTFLTGLGAIVGAAGSIVLTPFVRNLAPEIQLTIAASLGAFCSSILVCRENSIRRKISKYPEGKKNKSSLAKLRAVMFWLVLIGGLAAVAVAGLKISGRL